MTYFPRNEDPGTCPSKTSPKLKVYGENEPAGPTYSIGIQSALRRCVLCGWPDSISMVWVSVRTGNVRAPKTTALGISWQVQLLAPSPTQMVSSAIAHSA